MENNEPQPFDSPARASPVLEEVIRERLPQVQADVIVPRHEQQAAQHSNVPVTNNAVAGGSFVRPQFGFTPLARGLTPADASFTPSEPYDVDLAGYALVNLPVYRRHQSVTAIYCDSLEGARAESTDEQVEYFPGRFAPVLRLPAGSPFVFAYRNPHQQLQGSDINLGAYPHVMTEEEWNSSRVVIHHTIPTISQQDQIVPAEYHHVHNVERGQQGPTAANLEAHPPAQQNQGMPTPNNPNQDIPVTEVPVPEKPDEKPSAPETSVHVSLQGTPNMEDPNDDKPGEPIPDASDAEEFNFDALLFEDDQDAEFGEFTRFGNKQDKERYKQELIDQQKAAFASFQHTETSTKAAEEEEFQTVSKKRSFDPTTITGKQLDAAEKEMRRAMDVAQMEAKALTSRSGVVKDLDKDENSEQPCCTSSVQPVSSEMSGESTIKSSQRPKATGGKNKEKKVNISIKKDDHLDEDEAANYNMNLMLNAYFDRRRDILQTNTVPEKLDDEPDTQKFERKLFHNAINFPNPLTDVNRSNTIAFCELMIAQLPTMELAEEVTEDHRVELIKFFNILTTRKDDILVMDCAFIEDAIATFEEHTSHILWMYCSLCLHHRLLVRPSNDNARSLRKSGDTTRKTGESTETRAVEDGDGPDDDEALSQAVQSAKVKRLEEYYAMRRRMRETKFTTTINDNDDIHVKIEKTLINSATALERDITDKDFKFTKVFWNVLQKKMENWDLPKEYADLVRKFFKLLVSRADYMFAVDCVDLNKMLMTGDKKSQLYLCCYYQICMNPTVNLPTNE